jgi:peptide deformylase
VKIKLRALILFTLVGCTTTPPPAVPPTKKPMTTEATVTVPPGTKPIVQTGSKVLRDRAKEVDPPQITTPEMRELTKVMIETMRAAPGVGLAAPQIGLGIRVIVLEDRAELQKNLTPEEMRERERVVFPTRIIFNPVLTKVGDEPPATFFEGCLSVKGYVALVDRHTEVEVNGLDENAQPLHWRVRGWPARILQHEVDHLDGTLYIDRMKSRSFATVDHAKALYGGKPIAEIKRLLDLP